jgi:uncharacterized protein involved in exopolysaccharide biosynthesis
MPALMGARQEMDEVERVIADISCGRLPTARGLGALKSVARSLRARLPGETARVLAQLEIYMADAEKSKCEMGYEIGSLRVIAQYVIGKWPAIRQAMQQINEETDK